MPLATQSPLQKHRDWRFLLRDFISSHRSFQAQSSAVLKYALAPAASLAWWILTFRPDLLDKSDLKVLLPGVGQQECCDGGRWLSFTPWMLGRPELKMEFTLVGDELAGADEGGVMKTTGWPRSRLDREWATPADSTVQSRPAARIVNGLLADWHAQTPATQDLCVLFSPGFESHYREWLTDDALLPLVRSQVPVGAFSYSEMDYRSDGYVLKACGLEQPRDQAVKNPWSVETELSQAIGHFAQYGWLLSAPADAQPRFDDEAIRRLELASRYVREQFQQVGDPLMAALGAARSLEERRWLEPLSEEDARAADPSEVVYVLPDDYCVDAQGEVLRLFGDDNLEDVGVTIPQDVLRARPEHDGVERLIWAVELFQEYVADTARLDDFMPGVDLSPEQREMLLALTPGGNRARRVETPGSAAYFNAIERGDYAGADRLVQAKPELLEATDAEGKTGVMLAYDADESEYFEKWVRLGRGLDSKDSEGFAVVHDVIRRDDVAALRALGESGANLDLRSAAGFTPATVCLSYGAQACLDYLVEKDADLVTPSTVGRSVAAEFEDSALPDDLKARIRAAVAKQKKARLR